MKWEFPEKTRNSLPNMIREVNDRGASIPGFISLAIGNPAAEAIPVKEIKEAAEEVIAGDPMMILQYGQLGGADVLRRKTKERLYKVKHLPQDNQELLMISGSGQGLGLVPKAVCCEGDQVFTDEYAFTNALNAIRNSGCVLTGIPMDDDGMIPEALEMAAASGKGKYIYLIPNFHNPTGITMSLKRRKEIYEIARKYDLLIYEDDPYGELRFEGEEIPAIKTFDTDDRVIYAGSYSKILSAGLRIGFLYGNKDIIRTLQMVKNSMDGQSLPMITQLIVSNSLEKLDMNTYIPKICDLYSKKCKALIDGLHKTCAGDVKIIEPEGGMFVWMTLPERLLVEDYYESCMQQGIGVVKSRAFAADQERPGNSVRLNFTYQSEDEIRRAAEIIGKLTN